MDALAKPLFEKRKLVFGQNTRDGVKREQPFVKFVVFVDAELHAVARQQTVDLFLMVNQPVHIAPPRKEFI